ncbi:MAG TPA: hypothetical protein DDW94_06875 [Deltaproteobacteria bacterium]|nr:MAG: hypothetical protein A2Z79_01405 [Deltaproteobacteria bacterium GWA2_55_82]OGQ62056.1 MAG: hypothetical protein A3I81_03800 [Deltaproteobacteria bacterium RIFCSPLOWO2_02_FULL_55_12]OIJ74087.1 MAG: hypothetical protein A2V21_307315 [Deltaproteobacteria bacterium GWC2_55_46]HBG46700.1 hypothetical protein [Deltaproteobacteria bacterium]HCY11292.1 hypothetical protein [Deltaproteobacteria bacterium]
MQLLFVILTLILFAAAGASVIRLIDRSGETGLHGAPLIGIAFITGLGVVSLQMFILSLFSIPVTLATVSIPWLVFIAAVFLKIKGAPARRERERWDLASVLLLAIIIVQSAYSFVYALSVPLSGWDAWFIWFMKARVFYLDQGVTGQFLVDPNYQQHQDYPVMLPLAISLVYSAAGSVKEVFGKLLYPLQFLSLISVIYYATAKEAGRRTGLLFAALLSIVPVIMIHAGGIPLKIGQLYAGDFVGYSDFALSIVFLAASVFFYLYAQEGGKATLALSALFLGIGAWTKNEGLTFAIFSTLLFFVYRFKKGGMGFVRESLVFVPVIALFVLPWLFYRVSLGVGSEYVGNLSFSTVIDNLWKLGVIFKTLGRMLFLNVELYNFCWWAYVLSVAANWRWVFSRGLVALNLLLALQLSTYIFIYIISPAPIDWHLATSADRLLLHLLPLAMLITAFNLVSLAGLKSFRNLSEARSSAKAF